MTLLPDDATLEELERAVCEIIPEAGRIVNDRLTAAVEYKNEQHTDVVTEADREVERYVTEAVAARFPGHAVVGEEGQEAAGEYEWIVDPVDGTLNFVHGLSLYGISIGVLHCRRPVVGAVLFPATGELIHARKAGGAFRGGQAVRVREVSKDGPPLLGCVPAGFRGQFRVRGPLRRWLGETRSLGSISVEMALVAAGQLDYAFFRGPRIWDVAAGVLLIQEAGGSVLAYDRVAKGWRSLDEFVPPSSPGKPQSLRRWSLPLMVGVPSVTERMRPLVEPRYLPAPIVVWSRRYQRAREFAKRVRRAFSVARQVLSVGEVHK